MAIRWMLMGLLSLGIIGFPALAADINNVADNMRPVDKLVMADGTGPSGMDRSEIAQKSPAAEQPGAPRVFLLEGKHLQAIRKRIHEGDKSFAPALAALESEAQAALKAGPYSVVSKSVTPPSEDKHDYMSRAPYYWPDPAKPDGLPYISRDGERNPEIKNITDYDNMWKMAWDVETLSLAYYLTGNENYARKAAELIRTWFLDPATRMNPNLQYAQGIPGISTGRNPGIIESLAFPLVVDLVGLLAGSQSWTESDERGLKEWFVKYLTWLQDSELGRSESKSRNNHGTYYDVQVVTYALFLGNKDLAATMLREAKTKRIGRQIEPDGKQPLELGRTIALHYSIYNLRALFMLAKLAENVDVDLWNYRTDDGRSISKAIDYMIPFVVGEQEWPYKQISEYPMQKAYTVLRRAPIKYPDPRYRDMTSKFPKLDAEHRDNLLIPKTSD